MKLKSIAIAALVLGVSAHAAEGNSLIQGWKDGVQKLSDAPLTKAWKDGAAKATENVKVSGGVLAGNVIGKADAGVFVGVAKPIQEIYTVTGVTGVFTNHKTDVAFTNLLALSKPFSPGISLGYESFDLGEKTVSNGYVGVLVGGSIKTLCEEGCDSDIANNLTSLFSDTVYGAEVKMGNDITTLSVQLSNPIEIADTKLTTTVMFERSYFKDENSDTKNSVLLAVNIPF